MTISTRLRDRVVSDFAGSADTIAEQLAEASDSERVQAAIVLWAAGDYGRFKDSLRLAGVDWRDVLVRADLADDDWSERLERDAGANPLIEPRDGRDDLSDDYPGLRSENVL